MTGEKVVQESFPFEQVASRERILNRMRILFFEPVTLDRSGRRPAIQKALKLFQAASIESEINHLSAMCRFAQGFLFTCIRHDDDPDSGGCGGRFFRAYAIWDEAKLLQRFTSKVRTEELHNVRRHCTDELERWIEMHATPETAKQVQSWTTLQKIGVLSQCDCTDTAVQMWEYYDKEDYRAYCSWCTFEMMDFGHQRVFEEVVPEYEHPKRLPERGVDGGPDQTFREDLWQRCDAMEWKIRDGENERPTWKGVTPPVSPSRSRRYSITNAETDSLSDSIENQHCVPDFLQATALGSTINDLGEGSRDGSLTSAITTVTGAAQSTKGTEAACTLTTLTHKSKSTKSTEPNAEGVGCRSDTTSADHQPEQELSDMDVVPSCQSATMNDAIRNGHMDLPIRVQSLTEEQPRRPQPRIRWSDIKNDYRPTYLETLEEDEGDFGR